MTVEWQNKAESSVEYRRPSFSTEGGKKSTPDLRLRQLLMAKEPLCGIQPANISLVIAVLCFPSFSAVFTAAIWIVTRRLIYREKNI